MRIEESKNLKCDKITNISLGGSDYDKREFSPETCILESFGRLDDTLLLHFKNKTKAVIKAHNIEGSREIDMIKEKLPGLIHHSYRDILEIEI